MGKAGFAFGEIAQSGLLVAGEFGQFFDRFRKRLIFPIFNLQGTIVGFSGRSLDEKQEPKYLNSPETPIFQKGATLFGLNLAKEAIREAGFAILTEGEFDVISSHGVGVENVVAVKGTSLTTDQVKLIFRFCDQISICFDTDLAGDAAARRGIELADAAGLSIKVIQLVSAKDPDEAIKKSPQIWKRQIGLAAPVYDWLIDEVFKRFDATTPYGKKKISDEIVPILAKISDEVVKAHYVQKLATKLTLTEDALWEKAARVTQKVIPQVLQEGEDQVLTKSANRNKNLSEYFLALILQGYNFVKNRKFWCEPQFVADELRNFYQEVIISSLGRANFDLKSFAAALTADNLKVLDHLLFVNLGKSLETEAAFLLELAKVWQSLATVYYKEKIAQTLTAIKQARSENGPKGKLSGNLNFLLRQLANVQKGV